MREKCIVCGGMLYKEPLYVKKNMPSISQNLPKNDQLYNDLPIEYRICQCSGCGLVQFDCDPVSYYKDSTRAGERCEVLIDLRKKQYSHLIETYKLNGKKIIEIGAGKGGFLKTLKELYEYDIHEFGIENNPDFVRIAKEIEHVNVFCGDVENPDAVFYGAPYDAFTSFAYPARLVDPNTMLQNVYNNTTSDAVGLLQVPSMEHLLKPGGFFDVTRDHIAYYDEKSLRFLVEKNGFEVVEFGEVAQIYIYAIIKKRHPYNLKDAWRDVDKVADNVRTFVKELKRNNKKIAVWCAGHYAFTVLSLSDVGDDVSYIVDNAEFKKGRFSPATHVPIYGPEHLAKEPVDVIMILGPIYVEEIKKEIMEKCSAEVKIVTIINGEIEEVN